MATQGRASTTTILFTDLVGSTELSQRLGDDQADQLRRVHFRLLRESIAAHGGQEVKSLGDGLMVVFTSALDAVSSAIAVQQAVYRHNEQQGEAQKLHVRIGLNAGEPIRDEEDYFGTPVVIAGRLCDDAKGGQIIASALVRGLVGSRGGVAFRDLGPLVLKGLAEPLAACEVLWEPVAEEPPAPAPRVEEPPKPLPLPPVLGRRRTAFVGREAEMDALRRHWDDARGGERRLVLVAGEPGIGKTRLAGEFARGLHAEGVDVLYGRCDEEAVVPYQPFAEALSHYAVHCPPDALRRQLAGSGAEIVRLLPELSAHVPGLPHPARGDPESERYRFFEAVRSVLAEACRSRPVLLVLDDLQWADKPTLLLLKHIVRAPEESLLFILATYRETDLARTHPLAEVLADLRRERAFERVTLKGLDEAAVGDLMASRAGYEADPAFVRAIHDQTDGNPFFIEEVLASLVESGGLYQREGRWVSDATSADELGIPEGVREVVGRRLSRLSDACNSVLHHAAVLGREFDFALLARMTGVEDDTLLAAVEEALAAQVIVEVRGRSAPTYAFGHALVRQTLYEELTLPRKQRLHLRAAEVIEDAHAGAIEPQLATLAVHYRLAGAAAPVEKALDYSLRAGEAARKILAYEETATHWEAALEIMGKQDSEPESRARLEERLGDLMLVTGEPAKGVRYLEKALKLYEGLGQENRTAQIHSRLGTHLSSSMQPIRDINRAVEHYRAAQGVLAREPERAPMGYLYVGLATTAVQTLHTEEGLADSRRAMEIGDRLGNRGLWGIGALLHGWHLVASGRLAEGLGLEEKAAEEGDRLNDVSLCFFASWLRGLSAGLLYDPRDSQGWYQRELAKARLAQAPNQRRQLRELLIGASLAAGDVRAVQLPEAQVDTVGTDIDIPDRYRAGPWAWRDGDWERGEAKASEIREQHHVAGDRFNEGTLITWLARYRTIRGDLASAEALYKEALAMAAEGANVPHEVSRCSHLAVLYGDTGRPKDAAPHLQRCREILAGGEDWRGLAGWAALGEGAVAAAEGRIDDAERHFTLAVDIFRRYTLPWDEAEALQIWGRALLRAGDPTRADEKLNAAIAIYRRCNAGQPWIDLVEREKATA